MSNKSQEEGSCLLLLPLSPPLPSAFFTARCSELDLESLLQLGGERVCGGGGGALGRAVLQCHPLGFESVFLRRWRGLGGRRNVGRGGPAVGPVKGRPAVRGLEGGGAYLRGQWRFHVWGNVTDGLSVSLCGGTGRDRIRLGLGGGAKHIGHHLGGSYAKYGNAGLRIRQPVGHWVRGPGRGLGVEGGLAGGHHGDCKG